MTTERVIEKVDETYIIDTLRRMTRDAMMINPADLNDPGDYGPIKEFLLEEFSALGMEAQALGRSDVPNLVGRLRGTEGETALLMAGHTDCVPVADETQWKYPPFGGEVHDGKLYGRGTLDDRGGIVAAMGAAKAIVDSGEELKGDLIIVGYADSEASGGRGTKILAEKHSDAIKANWGIGLEPSFFNIAISVKGLLWATITTKGLQGHAGGIYIDKENKAGIPVNAVEKMAKILVAMLDVDRWMEFTTNPYFGTESGHYTKKPTVQVGGRLMVGEKGSIGDRVNIVPALCKCEVDIRTVPGQTGEGVIKEFQTLVEDLKKEDPDINATIEPFTCLDPQELSPDSELVRAIVECSTPILNKEPQRIGGGITSSTAYFGHLMPFVNFGCSGEGMHTPNECVDLDSLFKSSQIYTCLARRFLG